MKILKEYSIKASTVEDALENWIWTNDETFDRYIKILNPKITTVRQPSYDMGSVAMRMLIKILNNKPIEQDQYVLDYKIINRESTK